MQVLIGQRYKKDTYLPILLLRVQTVQTAVLAAWCAILYHQSSRRYGDVSLCRPCHQPRTIGLADVDLPSTILAVSAILIQLPLGLEPTTMCAARNPTKYGGSVTFTKVILKPLRLSAYSMNTSLSCSALRSIILHLFQTLQCAPSMPATWHSPTCCTTVASRLGRRSAENLEHVILQLGRP